jgi:hypothetical protein
MNLRHAVKGGLLAAAALLAASAWAQVPGGPQGEAPQGMGPMRGFERLHRQLNLNPQQEDLWKRAQGLQREALQTMRAKAQETRAKLRVEIDKAGVDLKQFAQLGDKLRDEMRAQGEATRKQVRAAWFAVYDALNPEQKEQVRVAIRDGMDRAGRMGRFHRGELRGERHGDRQGRS